MSIIPFPQFEIRTPWCDVINRLANVVNFSLVHRDGGVWNLLIADIAGLLQFFVHTLNVFVQIRDRERLSAIRTLCAFVVVHLSYVSAKVAHSKFFLTVRARLLDPFVGLTDVSRKVVHADILLTVRAVCLLSQVDALHVVVQKLLCLELLLTVGTLIIPNLLMEVFHMVVQVLVLFVTDVTC